MTTSFRAWLAVALVAVCSTSGVRAQEQEAEANGGDSAAESAAAPAWIAVPEIPGETEHLKRSLRRLSASAAVDSAVAGIEGDLSRSRSQSEEQQTQAEAVLARNPTLEQLRDLERGWRSHLASVGRRRSTLSQRAEFLESEVGRLSKLEGLWKATLESARATRAPPEILQTASDNLRSIESVSRELHGRRATVLKLLTAVSDQEIAASELVERIAAARTRLRERLFEPDSRPLWSAIVESPSHSTTRELSAASSRRADELSTFVSERKQHMLPLAAIFAIALAVALRARRAVRARIDGAPLEGTASVFERPVSVALLVTAFAAAGVLSFAPSVAWDVVGFALLVPVLRILAPTLPASARSVLWVLAILYAVDLVREVLAPAALLERILFLIEMTIAGLVVLSLLRSRAGGETRVRSQAATGLRGLLWCSAVIYVVAFAANVFGYDAFSRLSGEGALVSTYLGLAAYAAYRIATTLLVLLVTSRRLQGLGVVRSSAQAIIGHTEKAFAVIAACVWALAALDAFELRDVAVLVGTRVLSTPLEIGAVSISLGNILAFPLAIFLAVAASRTLRSILKEDVYPRFTMSRGVDNAVSTTVHYALLLGGIFFALGAAGIDLSKFGLLAGALGVGIGFGLQNVVNNFVSGLILLYERPIQVGDTIELGGLLGDVKQIGIRASTIVTFQGAEVIIPNGTLLSEHLINWTLSNKHRRVELPIGVAYGNRPSDVIEVLNRVFEGEDRILADPAPMVLFRGYGDSSLDFELRFWVRDYMMYLIVASDIAAGIYDQLDAAGIEIPFPQRDLHLRSVDPKAAESLLAGGREMRDGGTANE